LNNSNYLQIQVKRDPANAAQVFVLANGESTVLSDVTPTGRQLLNAVECHPTADFALLQLRPNRSLEEIAPEEVATLSANETSFYSIRTDRLFYFTLNETKYPWGQAVPESILRLLAGAPAHAQIWMERQHEPDIMIQLGNSINLSGEGVERFYTKLPTWKLDVQGVEISSPEPTITVRHALELAGINTELPWTFILKTAGHPKEQVELTTVIDLSIPGIERLRVMPKVINNGEGPCTRRQFALLEKDETFLDVGGYRWETAIDGDRRWLLLYDYQLPAGYQQARVTLAIEIPLLYPSAELDMFYCAPAVALPTGTPLPQTEAQQAIFAETFQRWSRHRENKVWSPADDSVITHLGLVEEALLREVAQ